MIMAPLPPPPLSQPLICRPLSLAVLFLVIFIEAASTAAAVSSSSSSSHNSNSNSSGGINARSRNDEREERRRYANLPPTVFAPGGRLHGVERVAREAMLLYDDDDDNNDNEDGRRRGVKSDDDEEDMDYDGIDEEDVASCATFAICCRGNQGDDCGDEFAVMVGIGPVSPYVHRGYDQQTDSMDTKNREGYYRSLAIDVDDDQYDHEASLSPLSILSPHLVIGTGGKSIDSAILLRRTVEMAVDIYANEDGGVGWFISHSLESSGTTTMEEEELWTPRGGVASVDVSSLVRRVADIAQISTQSLGGRYGRMLSSSLLALGSRNPTNSFVGDDESNNNDYEYNIKADSTVHNNPENDALILWRVDPTGQFWRLDASAIGRGCFEVEREFLRHVNDWKLSRNSCKSIGGGAQLAGNSDDFPEEVEEDNSTVIHNVDVRAYLGSVSVNDAVQLATDCLVNGIMNRRSSMRRRSRRNSMSDSVALERRNKIYERGLRKRVRAVIVRSNAKSNHRANDHGRSRRPYIEIVV